MYVHLIDIINQGRATRPQRPKRPNLELEIRVYDATEIRVKIAHGGDPNQLKFPVPLLLCLCTICKRKGRPSSFSDIFFNFLLRPLVCLHFESEERVILRRGRSPIFAGYFSISQIPFDLEKSKACFGNGKLSSTYDILSIFPHFQSIKPQKEKNEDMAIQFSQIM